MRRRFLVPFMLCGALIAPLASASALAQTTPTTPTTPVKGRHMRGMMAMLSQLNLTDDEKAKLKPVVMAHAEKAKAIRKSATLAPADKKMQMRELHRTTMEQIRPILTPDQWAQFKAMHKHRNGTGAPPPPSK